MGTKVYGNYEDLITFTRASGGHALRPVSYGSELVDTANTASSWTAYGTNTVAQDGDAVKITYVDNSQGAFIYLDASGGLSSSFEQGKLYRLTAEAKINTGSASLAFYDGSATNVLPAVSSTTYIELSFNFVFSGSNRPYINTSGLGSGEIFHIKSVSIKEVTFDKSDGTLTLFEHPDNIPRVEWDAQRNRLGLLVEESRTNLVTYSNSSSNWSNTETTVSTQSNTLSGISDAILSVPTTTTALHFHVIQTATPAANTVHTASIYAKASGYSHISIEVLGFNSNYVGSAKFNLDSGVATLGGRITGSANLSTEMQSVGNGWYRCIVSCTMDSNSSPTSTPRVNIIIDDDGVSFQNWAGDGTSGVLIYGAQLEAGSFPTSYIKTTGATATRSSDFPSIPVADFGFNSAEGTVVCELQHFTTESVGAAAGFALDDGSSSNRLYYYQNKGQWIGSVSGTTTLNIDAADTSENTATKVAVTYKKDDFVLYRNGSLQGTDTSSEVPAVTTFFVGNSSSNTELFGHIKSIQYYPRRLTNAQLQALTS